MGKVLSAAVKAAAVKAAGAGGKPRGVVTDTHHRKVFCVVCGCPVRSKLGDVCSRPRCHRIATARGEQ